MSCQRRQLILSYACILYLYIIYTGIIIFVVVNKGLYTQNNKILLYIYNVFSYIELTFHA